jgi:hypothetical protein
VSLDRPSVAEFSAAALGGKPVNKLYLFRRVFKNEFEHMIFFLVSVWLILFRIRDFICILKFVNCGILRTKLSSGKIRFFVSMD